MGFWDRLLDKSIVFSFDRTGFGRHSRRFTPGGIPTDLSHRHLVITGANSGIGFATAEAWASRGGRVTLICRNPERAAAASAELQALSATAHIETIIADLSELSAVEHICEHLNAPIHALVHNAGNMVHERQDSSDGVELITALHVVVPYALTLRLLPQLKAGADTGRARVIFIASGGMYTQPYDLNALHTPPEPYDGTRHYAQTKRAQVVLAEALHPELSGLGISVHAMHPGWVDTPAIRRAMPGFFRMTRPILRSPEQGADTIVWLSSSEDPDIDQAWGFWFDRERAPVYLSKATEAAQPEEKTLRPWLDTVVNSTGIPAV